MGRKLRLPLVSTSEYFVYPPDRTMASRWLVGLVLPAWLAWIAIHALWTHEARMPARHRFRMVDIGGPAAVSWGAFLLSIAAFLHFHGFFGTTPGLMRFRMPLMVAALLCGIASLGSVCFFLVS